MANAVTVHHVRRNLAGQRLQVVFQVDMSAAVVAGGDILDLTTQVGLTEVDYVVVSPFDGTYDFRYVPVGEPMDPTAGKIKVSTHTSGAEATGDLSTLKNLRCFAVGY